MQPASRPDDRVVGEQGEIDIAGPHKVKGNA
jgi:hypothetical protein